MKILKDKITAYQALLAVQELLAIYLKKTASDSIGALLSSMLFVGHERTADQAIWQDWMTFFSRKKYVTRGEAFDIMHAFLKNYYQTTSSKNVQSLLLEFEQAKGEKSVQLPVQKLWGQCIEKILTESDDSAYYLHLNK